MNKLQVYLTNVDEKFKCDIEKACSLCDQSRNQLVTSAVRGHVKRVISACRSIEEEE